MNFLQIFLQRFRTQVVLAEINYKSGISRRFYVSNLEVKWGSDKRVEWNSLCDDRPVVMNVDEIESVWQVKGWTKFTFFGLRK